MDQITPPDRRRSNRKTLAWLASEIEAWEQQGFITPEQGQAIRASYGGLPHPYPATERFNRLVSILAVLGAILIGTGVIAFIASNWATGAELPRGVKLFLIFVAISLAYGIGYWQKYVRENQRVGSAIFLLGALLFGAGIHLVAQSYNFPVNDPKLFSYWFLGVLPLAYLTRSQSMLFLAVGLFLASVGFWTWDWINHDSQSLIVMSGMFLVMGLLLYNLGRFQGQVGLTKAYTTAYEVLGLLAVFATLYLLSFRDVFEDFDYQDTGFIRSLVLIGDFWWLLHSSVAFALLALAAHGAWRLKHRIPWQTLPYEGVASLLLLTAAYLPIYLAVGGDITYPILFNILLFLMIAGTIIVGYVRNQEGLINLALIFFGFDLITRYFEYSWSLIDRSLVFILAGVLLLGGALALERGRRTAFARLRAKRS